MLLMVYGYQFTVENFYKLITINHQLIYLSLALFVFRIGTNNNNPTFASDRFTLDTAWFYRSAYLHIIIF